MSDHNVISVTTKNAVAVAAALAKFDNIDRENPRDAVLSIDDEWLIARFGPSAALRNAALQFIMDRIGGKKGWANVHHHLRDVQPIVDRDESVFEEFIANSPNTVAVEWATKVLKQLRRWKKDSRQKWPPFVMTVMVVPDSEIEVDVAPAPIIEEPVLEVVEEVKSTAKTPKVAKTKAPAKAKGTTISTGGKFVNLADLQQAGA